MTIPQPVPPDVKLIPRTQCPHCAYTLTAVGTADKTAATMPTPGDRTVCMRCVAVLVFTDALTLRGMTIEEFEQLPIDDRDEIGEIAARIRLMHRTFGPPGVHTG